MTATQAPTPGPLTSDGAGPYSCIRCDNSTWNDDDICDQCAAEACAPENAIDWPDAPTAPVEASGSEEIGDEYEAAAHCVTLAECPPGLFFWNGTLGFKSEYGAMEPVGSNFKTWKVGSRADAYCADSGEYFWGGTSNHDDRAKVLVMPIDAATVAMVASHGPAALRPQPSGETREALDRLKMAAHVYEDDEMAADCATLEALLSARPLALEAGCACPKPTPRDTQGQCAACYQPLTTPARAEAQDEGPRSPDAPCNCFGDSGMQASTYHDTDDKERCDLCGGLVSNGPEAQDEGAAGDEAVALRQARHVLKDLHAKDGTCGYDKLASACERAADRVQWEAHPSPTPAAVCDACGDKGYVEHEGDAWWKSVIGEGAHVPSGEIPSIKNLHPAMVKPIYDAHKGTAVADVIAGLIFHLTVAFNRAECLAEAPLLTQNGGVTFDDQVREWALIGLYLVEGRTTTDDESGIKIEWSLGDKKALVADAEGWALEDARSEYDRIFTQDDPTPAADADRVLQDLADRVTAEVKRGADGSFVQALGALSNIEAMVLDAALKSTAAKEGGEV